MQKVNYPTPLGKPLLGGLAAVGLLFAGCAAEDKDTTSTPGGSGTEAPTPGGTYVHALEADPGGCLDGAQQRYHVAFNIIRQATDSLVDLDPTTGEIVPWLAESWEISEDAKDFTFKLKQGVTFSNGEPFDATAVKLNFDRINELGPQAIGGYPVIAGYTGTEVIDDLTAKVSFDTPNIQFLQGLSAAWLGLISPTDTAKSPEELCAGDYSGTGPFVIESYAKNDQAVLVKREGYNWPSKAYKHTGNAYLDRIEFKFLSESSVRSGSLISGQVHSISAVTAQDEATITGAGNELLVTQPPGLELTWIANQRSRFGADPTVRQAVAWSIDRDELTTLYGSGFEVAKGILGPPSMPYYVDQSDLIKYDPAAAEQLLEEAGWVKGEDGIRVKDGQRLTLNLLFALPEQAELIQQQFLKVGIDAPVQKRDSAAQSQALTSGDYDFYIWNMTRGDPDVLRGIFISGLDGQGQNASFALPTEADQYLQAQSGDADPAKRQEDVKAAVDYLVIENLAIPALFRSWVYAYSPDVHGFGVDGEAKLVLYDTWIDQ
ncbi:MAG: ABC transporter substrate-binding protein [Bifidobacteriaceae bacterium]|jgi:peptide/nickel transport system substrate-binding protein|nr:ABC transporter substrate-binding protein [Bifidobacteriaceae bacterium]